MKKKKTIASIILIILLLSAGLFFIIKPEIENKKNLKKQGELIEAIDQGEETIEIELEEDKSESDYYSIDFCEELKTMITPVPSENPLEDDVAAQVNGIGIIEIASIDLKLPIVEGVENSKLKVAVGHLPSSAEIAEEGNCIIAGHRNYTYGEMFNRLDEVNVGDIIQIKITNGSVYEYKVYAITVVEPGSELLFECDEGQCKLTLITCTPVRKATHRLLVMAELME